MSSSQAPSETPSCSTPPSQTDGIESAWSDSDNRGFRDVLGCFATGVTVITTMTSEGMSVGVTISSFNSVSLDPPLIVWSLSCESPKLQAFAQSPHYVVNVLADNQQTLSERFAARNDDSFSGLPMQAGLGGAPLLEGCSAWLECVHEAQHAGGDHLILVGRVLRFRRGAVDEPLIFHGGRYRGLRAD